MGHAVSPRRNVLQAHFAMRAVQFSLRINCIDTREVLKRRRPALSVLLETLMQKTSAAAAHKNIYQPFQFGKPSDTKTYCKVGPATLLAF
ncbi:hypothetical protein AWB64_03812 [Caballeronia sordidicola]|uniref:Uncharacterized protein n=1 Tax=Caballeronia sordidicola TaxID=196367 RepID=A0A158H080_CABSO|nr:hypothetical protein AWB64_03812 [Caballeronia sordidicola]